MEKSPFMIALLPCGLRNAFKAAFFEQFSMYDENADEPKVIIEGNLNYEKFFYEKIDELSSINNLPDIFISSDINSLYHNHFLNNFLKKDYFEDIPVAMNNMYSNIAYKHPEGLMTMLAPNLLVIVADNRKFGNLNLPTSWEDLLHPKLKQQLVLRGDKDFFCNALFFPYIKQFGYEAISQIAQNTRTGMHPAEMVKDINLDNTNGISAYVMPYSFYLKIRKKEHFQLIWPKEGAIVSPVQMLIKKGSFEKYKTEIDFITGRKMCAAMVDTGFPSTHVSIENTMPQNLNWIGWDFIYNNDIKLMKEEAQKIFFENYTPSKQLHQYIYLKS